MRAVTGLAQGCPSDFLSLETDVEPLANRMEKIDEILREKYQILPDKDPRKEMRKTSGLGPPAMLNLTRFSISSYGTRDVSPESPSVL